VGWRKDRGRTAVIALLGRIGQLAIVLLTGGQLDRKGVQCCESAKVKELGSPGYDSLSFVVPWDTEGAKTRCTVLRDILTL
jgi:hypothetical protein